MPTLDQATSEPPYGPAVGPVSRSRRSSAKQGLYDAPFWYAYGNNLCLMMAMSLLFRFGDYVAVLCGPEMQAALVEWHLGMIVGVGMVGGLVTRLALGPAIVNFGARSVWVWSVVGCAISLLLHVFIRDVNSPAVYAAQIAWRTGVAGAFGAAITYISSRVPVVRVPEAVGMLGTSGFLGMMLGSGLGDLLFWNAPPVNRWHVDCMFYVSAALCLFALLFALMATRGAEKPVKRKQPSLWWLLKRYHPGMLLLVGVAVGAGVNLAHTYLRPFAEELQIHGIALFFWFYACTAFVTRFLTRQSPQKHGIRPMILVGLGTLAASMLLYMTVRQWWQLAIPAVVAGLAHACLFPSVTGGGSISFPTRYRGLGVTLVLATFDLGNLIGAPLAGSLLHLADDRGWQRYPFMFTAMALLLTAVAVFYGWWSRGAAKGGQNAVSVRVGKVRKRRPRKRKARSGATLPEASAGVAITGEAAPVLPTVPPSVASTIAPTSGTPANGMPANGTHEGCAAADPAGAAVAGGAIVADSAAANGVISNEREGVAGPNSAEDPATESSPPGQRADRRPRSAAR